LLSAEVDAIEQKGTLRRNASGNLKESCFKKVLEGADRPRFQPQSVVYITCLDFLLHLENGVTLDTKGLM
jgi:hypothetical protein